MIIELVTEMFARAKDFLNEDGQIAWSFDVSVESKHDKTFTNFQTTVTLFMKADENGPDNKREVVTLRTYTYNERQRLARIDMLDTLKACKEIGNRFIREENATNKFISDLK